MRKAINPFDDDYYDLERNEEVACSSSPGEDEIFHDAQQDPPRPRAAPLNFDNPFDQEENPALTFNPSPRYATDFVSPLESAMMEAGKSPAKDTGYSTFSSYRNAAMHNFQESEDEDEITEGSALLPSKLTELRSSSPGRHRVPTEIDTSAPSMEQRRSTIGRRSSLAKKNNIVLKELLGGENEFTMDYKYILLEDLGTSSSWLVLLLPYVAFFVALLLESSTSLRISSLGPLSANNTCTYSANTSYISTLSTPCFRPYKDRLIDHGRYNAITGKYNKTMSKYSGVMFDSGVLLPIPVLSTDLYGDAVFERLTADAVALVSKGMVEASLLVLQKSTNTEGDQDVTGNGWVPMFSSLPRRLSMACVEKKDGQWDCNAPRLLDLVFSMPDAMVYGGGEIKVQIFYSIANNEAAGENMASLEKLKQGRGTILENERDRATDIPMPGTATTEKALEELVSRSSYTLEHMSDLALRVDTGVRLSTFLVTLAFAIYWCKCMGVHLTCCLSSGKRKSNILWWESPWLLFPERWYIVILLVALLLLQEPVLALVSFLPGLGASIRLHIAADATIGIGVQIILFVYLCLLSGLSFHTALVTKRRTEHQRRILQLRRAAKYVSKSEHPASPTDDGVSDYVKDYFDRFGDVDGSASTAFLQLPNDPFSDGWLDFVFSKFLLLLVGVAAVVGTAYYRFPPTNPSAETMDENEIHRLKWAYIVCVVTQFSTLVIWMIWLLIVSVDSGRRLRKEPFLSTRPAQLAYRVLLVHISLGFTVLVLSIASNFSQVRHKWLPGDLRRNNFESQSLEESSKLEVTIRVLSGIAYHFPYSGTAASVGSGKILFATVSIIITAFIFLPAHILEEDIDDPSGGTSQIVLNEKLHEQRRLRRDKRLVVNLARDAKTWRIFPLPIKQSTVLTTMLQDDAFQLYSDFHTDGTTNARGVVSIGPYTPVFCLELACWLNEASWQAYYSPAGITPNDPNVGAMNIEGLGLRLEGAIYDESTDTQAYVSTNFADQVDGEEDTIIVIAFRGSMSSTNLQTDLKSKQVPLLDQLAGIGSAAFSVLPEEVVIHDEDGWIWETPTPLVRERLQCVTSWTSQKSSCKPSHASREGDTSKLTAVADGARKILQATPVAKESFPLVHQGFQEVYIHIRKQLFEILFPVLHRQFQSILAKAKRTSSETRKALSLPKIYCTGHSLGGSLAQLLALDLANNCELVIPASLNGSLEYYYDAESNRGKHNESADTLRLQVPVAVYTYGQPRVGNKTFSRLYKQRVPHSFRVVNEGDAITSMPNYLCCGGIYKHSGLEVLLDEGQTGNILVGPTVVETLFRFSKVRTSVMAHTMQRYRDCLECAFDQDELLEYYRGHNLVMTSTSNDGAVESSDIPAWLTRTSNIQQ